MRVLICGDRSWTDQDAVRVYISKLPAGSVVIHGAAKGADTLAERYAILRGLETIAYPANWRRNGRAAGPVRNRQMLVDGRPDLVVYFHEDLGQSKGTANMVQQARKAGIPVKKGVD